MGKRKGKKAYQKVLDFNGGWTTGEANHPIGKKSTQRTPASKKLLNLFCVSSYVNTFS